MNKINKKQRILNKKTLKKKLKLTESIRRLQISNFSVISYKK